MKRLIVIEGFDRSGKDTLMQDLANNDLPNTWVYFNDLAGLPKYDKEQEDFLVWLNKLIQMQVNKLNELFDTYDTVIMTRFIVSDEVYSTLFSREHTVIKYLSQLRKDIRIFNYCLLFMNYNEYTNRINKINEEIQYSKEEFDKINNLYLDELSKNIDNNYVYQINSNTMKQTILDNFLKITQIIS